VQAALVQRGVAADRLRAQGFGPERPVVDNQTEENRAKNRRVELRIEKRAP
jgi:OOP family OmpA-OmpF porin